MKKIICNLIIIIGVVLGLYVGGWLMFIKPILDATKAFNKGTLTGLMIICTIIKCFFAELVGLFIAYVFCKIADFCKRW